MTPAPDRRLVFVAGSGRSGTTALAEMLSSAPGVAYTPELKYFSNALSSRRRFEPYTSADAAEAFFRHAFEKVWKFNPGYEQHVDPLAAAFREEVARGGVDLGVPDDVYRAAFGQLVDGLTDREAVVVLQTPGDVLYWELVERLAGPVQWIVSVRDSRSFFASAMRGDRRWFRRDVTAVAHWNLSVRRGDELLARRPDRAVLVHQEELAEAPAAVLTRLADFVGVPEVAGVTVRHADSSFGAGAPVAGRHRQSLAEREAAYVTYLTRRALARHYPGESREADALPIPARAAARVSHRAELAKLQAITRLRAAGRAGAYFAARRVVRR